MLYGREREIERIEQLLASARGGTSDAIVLRGDPGAGKTALLRHAIERADSMLVLRATGYESEAQLEFSGLVEVCRPLLGSLDALPPVQAAALSSALGLSEPTQNDRFAVAAATLSLIAGAAEELPVLVLVDDAHWLDDASRDALLFAARRLAADPVAFLVATRPEGLEGSGLDEMVLSGLDRAAAELLVAGSAAAPVAPLVLESLIQATAALGGDRLEEAVAELAACAEWVTATGVLEVELAPEPDLVEALVRLGRSEEAAAVLDAWVARGARAATPWAPPLVATSQALLAGEEGFEALCEEALELHHAVGDPYLEARARLVYGERLRRAGRRVLAREQLRSAHAIFATLHCATWASRASRELRASGERLRSAAASGDELTPQEREIALQVAGSKSNKDAAAALFLSPKTVEFHLSRVYRKLDVTSRTELAGRLAGQAV